MFYIKRFLIAIFSICIIFGHQFFISNTELHYKEDIQKLEITIEVFTHDIDLILENANLKIINLGTEKEENGIDIFLVDYLSDNFIIQEYSWTYLGKEVGNNYTYFYLEITDFSLSEKISILNTIFMNVHARQRNMVNFYSGEIIQSASMTNADPVFSFNF